MKTAIILFPGINRERDMAKALEMATGQAPAIVWHTDSKMFRKCTRSSPTDSRRESIAASVRPLISFIAKYGRSSAISPSSYTGTMPGCCSWPPICASSTKRCRDSGRALSSGCITFSATSRPRSVS